MEKIAQLTIQNDCAYLSGCLNFETVMLLWEQALPYIENASALKFDFQEVVDCNSAGLILLLQWFKLAEKKHKAFHFVNLPKQLLAMAEAANMNFLFV